ncbi:MAG: carbohydrate-binding domain-containing protein [Tepidisphaeraceae bacterium]
MRRTLRNRKLESLEARRLLSSAVLQATGQLRIDGDAKVDDIVTIGLNARGEKVDVLLKGGTVQSFAKAKVKTIAFYGRSGADTFSVSESNGPISARVLFFGGDGSDTFIGGSEEDWVNGDAGDDTLLLGGGQNIAHGGDGNDRIVGGSTRDVILGNYGNDSIDAGTGSNYVDAGIGNDSVAGGTANDSGTSPVTGPKIYIIYNGTSNATIINPYASVGVTITASGGAVTVTGASGLSNLEYDLLGTSSSGSLTMSSTTPALLVLNGLSLTNASGPAINITGGQANTFLLTAGTTSTLSDGSGNAKNGAVQSDGKITFSGTGVLNLAGVKKHGIVSTSAIEVQSSTITVTSAVSDAFHSEGFVMSGGSVTVSASGADGIDAGDSAVSITGGTINVTSTVADVKAVKTGNNTINVTGGALNLNVSGNASKAISAKGAITTSAGTFVINLAGAAVLTASGLGYDPSYCTGVKSDVALNLNGGDFTIITTAAATGAKGFSAGGDINITSGTFNVTTAGGGAAYTNTLGVADSYSTSSFTTDANINLSGGVFTINNSGADGKGFSADVSIFITGGTIGVTNSGTSGKGFKADANITFGGTGSTTINLSGATVLNASGSGYDPSYPTGAKATGTLTVSGGSVSVTGTSAATGARALSANLVNITGGSVTANLAGNGATYTNSLGVKDSYKSAGLSSDTTITVSGGTINLTSSGTAGRGFNADGNITFSGGTTTVNLWGATLLAASGSGNDPSFPTGVKSDGIIAISNGSVTVIGTSTATGARGLSAATINVTGGTVSSTLAGNGATYTNSSGVTDSYAAAALSADTAISITAGSVTTTSSGTGGKGLKSDGTITIGSVSTTPTLNITTTGARFLQSGSDYNHPKTVVATGAISIISGATTLNSTDDGIHSDTSITISGGNINVSAISTTSGVGEGIEAPIINFTGGVTNVTASNDAINTTYGTVAGGTNSDDNSQLNISGGILIATGSDAIDSNGDITITGGTTIVCGPTSQPEEGIDYNGQFYMNGGFLISAGSNSGMTLGMTTGSTQVSMFIKSTSALASTSVLHIENTTGTEMVTFKPKNNVYYFHFSSASLAQNSQYRIYFGGTYTGGSYVGNTTGWGLYTGGTWSSTGATLKSTVTTSASAKTNTFTF